MNCANCGTMLGAQDRACAVCGSRSKPPGPSTDELPIAQHEDEPEPQTIESRPQNRADGPDTELRNKKLAREPEDLSKEHMLARAPRVRFRGAERPAVGQMILLAKLGQGGMGVVYFGVHPRLGTEVAVKVLAVQGPSASDPQHVARFLREARLAASLRSEHLVGVLDVNHDDEAGLHYIVMEYVRGVAAIKWLESFQKTKTKVPEALALDLVIAATKGLAAAHENGIVHRDVKPDNILLPQGPDGTPAVGRAKLADLGLARSERGGDTVTGAPGTMGSPGFMAPEQVDGRVPITRAADVFGMGATLHALLAGASPFIGGTPLQTIVKTVQNQCEPILRLRPDCSPQTAAIIARCLDPLPPKRYPDAGALLSALESARRLVALPKAGPEPKTGDEELATKSLVQMSPAELAAATQQAAFAGTPAPRDPEPPPGPFGRSGTVVSPPPAATAAWQEPPKPKSKVPLLLAGVGVLVVVAGVAAAVMKSDEPPPTPPAPRAATPETKPAPVVPKPEPAPAPVVPPRDLEAERRAEEAKKTREAEDARLAEVKRKQDALRAKFAEVDEARSSGNLEKADLLLRALERANGWTAEDGYDASAIAKIRAGLDADLAAAKRKTDLQAAETALAAGKLDVAITAFQRAGETKRIGEIVGKLVRRGKDRDAAGEHLGAIDDFALVIAQRDAIPDDGSVDLADVTLGLVDAAIAIGEWKRAEKALGTLVPVDASSPRAVVLRGKLYLAWEGSGENKWRTSDKAAINALPADAQARLCDEALARGEAALARREFDEALLDGRVAGMLNAVSTRSTFLIGAASAGRAVSDRRRPNDLTTAKRFLELTLIEVRKAGANPSAELRALGAKAQQLLDGLPR